jgi:hypothetical protein
MNRFGRCLRNLLLIALVGWAGVDDYLPSVGTFNDPGAESGESLLFDAAGCRRAGAAAELSPSSGGSRAISSPLRSAGIPVAALSAPSVRFASRTDSLYALMSLRR